MTVAVAVVYPHRDLSEEQEITRSVRHSISTTVSNFYSETSSRVNIKNENKPSTPSY